MAATFVVAPPVAAAPVDHAPLRLLLCRLLSSLTHPQKLQYDCCSAVSHAGFRGCNSLAVFRIRDILVRIRILGSIHLITELDPSNLQRGHQEVEGTSQG